jgi:hypothetical protein
MNLKTYIQPLDSDQGEQVQFSNSLLELSNRYVYAVLGLLQSDGDPNQYVQTALNGANLVGVSNCSGFSVNLVNTENERFIREMSLANFFAFEGASSPLNYRVLRSNVFFPINQKVDWRRSFMVNRVANGVVGAVILQIWFE